MRSRSDMHGYQDRTATILYEQTGVQLVMPMGSGKTATGLTAIRDLIDDGHIRCALVIAPKRVAQLVWPAEPREWEHLHDMRVLPVTGSPEQRLQKLLRTDAEVYVVGRDNIKWLVDELKKLPDDHKLFDFLLIDELSGFKNPRGKRIRALRGIGKRFRAKHGMTGTPRPNGYEDQFAPLTFLSDGQLWGKSFDKWREERFMPLDYFGHKWSIRPEHRDRTLADISSVSATIDPAQMPELPPLVDVVHWVDLPPSVMKTYKAMERDLVAKINSRTVMAASAGVATGKLAQVAQGFMYGEGGNTDVEYLHTAKTDLLVEMLEDLATPALIAYDFVEDLRVLQSLYPDLAFLGNGTSDKQAAAYEKAWNAMQLDRLALHPASAGHGLNLQKGGNQMFWYGLTWSAELYDQTIKRFYRQGQVHRCFNHLILARGTIDEAKFDRVHNKISEQEAFNNYLRRV